MKQRWIFQAALVWFASSPVIAASTPATCADAQLSVVSTSTYAAALTCNFATQAKTRISQCGLLQTEPIQITLVDSINHDGADCLSTYNCSTNAIQVTDPTYIETALGEDNPYKVLPVEIVFQALISHEMAHALLEQSSRGTNLEFVDHEWNWRS